MGIKAAASGSLAANCTALANPFLSASCTFHSKNWRSLVARSQFANLSETIGSGALSNLCRAASATQLVAAASISLSTTGLGPFFSGGRHIFAADCFMMYLAIRSTMTQS